MTSPLSDIPSGIKPSRIYLPHEARYLAGSVLDFFCQHFAHIAAGEWQRRFALGLVTDHTGEPVAATAGYRDWVGQTLSYYRAVADEPLIPFEPVVLFVDEHLLVVDKPHFLPVIPSGQFVSQTLLAKLRCLPELGSLNVADISPLHRLDKDTAGVMLLSHNPASRGAYQRLFASQQMHKQYHAVAKTRTDLTYPYRIANRIERGEPFFLSQIVSGDINAITEVALLKTLGELSLYQLTPLSGKKHQLRLHLANLGMPIVNDRLYPQVAAFGTQDFSQPLQLLAKQIAFVDPITGKRRCFTSQQRLQLVAD